MTTELAPIFKLRELCLAVINPKFYAENADLIHRASLAAQEYVFSGASREYHAYMGNKFHDLPGYVKIHEKYDIADKVNPNLVMDLAWGFKSDCLSGIIDVHGNIKNRATLNNSRIMGVYHNTTISGTPINAFKLYPERIEKLLFQAQQQTK